MNKSTPKDPEFTEAAQKLWDEIPDASKEKILSNAWCGECLEAVKINPESGSVVDGNLLIQGKCSQCGGEVARFIENE